MRIKIFVDKDGLFRLAENPNPIKEECYILEAIEDEIEEGLTGFPNLDPGLYECDVSWPVHRCTHPECAHDDQELEYTNLKTLFTLQDLK